MPTKIARDHDRLTFSHDDVALLDRICRKVAGLLRKHVLVALGSVSVDAELAFEVSASSCHLHVDGDFVSVAKIANDAEFVLEQWPSVE